MKVIIIGGGFAGLKLADKLVNKEGIEVLMIDKYNYHQFQPLFYQVATAALDASNISFPLRKAFHKSKNIKFRLAKLESVDSANNKIITSIGDFDYDILVLATGADTNWFGNDKLKAAAFPMKSTTEALQLRHRLIENFESALIAKTDAERKSLMTLVIAGAGPTGVEVSGALSEMRNKILPKDYPELDFKEMRVILLEGSSKVLEVMSEKSSRDGLKYLLDMGVEVKLGIRLQDYDGNIVTLNDGSTIESKTVIWAAGVAGNIPAGIDKTIIVRGNRITVDRFNKIKDSKNIYAIGDLAYMETPLFPKGHPQLANVAINQGINLAKNLIKLSKQESDLKEYEYSDKGSMATVGRHRAVVDVPKPKLHFRGYIAWLMWMGLHLLLILGVKNKIQIFINWIYKYFTWDQSLRLLIKDSYRNPREKNENGIVNPK